MISLRPHARLEPLLAGFSGASPELLASRELLQRVDTKFALPLGGLDQLLEELAGHYAVLRVPTGSLASYRSLYFDTPDLQCFHDHRRGRRIRHKVRIRHYPDRTLTFLEIKTKRNEQVTDKKRRPLPYGTEELGGEDLGFLRSRLGGMADVLEPQVWIAFRRLTLIGLATQERVTIDLDLDVAALGALAIVEVKQSPFCVRTPVMRALYDAGHREGSVSKYVAALATGRPELRQNRLLPGLRSLEKIAP
jgi:hypothetical protein